MSSGKAGFFKEMMSAPVPPLERMPLYSFFVHPLTPLLFGLVYFTSAKLCNRYNDGKNRLLGKRWKAVLFAHNAALAAYSAWTFASTAPMFLGGFWRAWREGGGAGLAHVFCDSNLAAWNATQFPFYCYLFYLSKYYEILDSVILILKGRQVGMLQSYHHAGALLTMWAGFRFSAPPIWIFVVFNSLVHLIMYSYYATSSLKIPFPNVLKRQITRLQITQFLVGGSLAASTLFIRLPALPTRILNASAAIPSPSVSATTTRTLSAAQQQFRDLHFGVESVERIGTSCLATKGQVAATVLNVAYLIPLTYLFVAFFIASYRRPAKGAAAGAGKGGKAVKAE